MNDFDPFALIDKRYPKNYWHIVYEVASDAGGKQSPGSRWADCIAIGRDSGETEYTVHGIEIKRSRSDVLNELRNPEKSRPFLAICNRWWMLCPPNTVDLALSLPPQWGITTQDGKGKFKTIRQAPFNADARITPIFVYSLMSATLRERHENAKNLRIDQMVRMIAQDENLFERAKEIREIIDAREDKLCKQMWG